MPDTQTAQVDQWMKEQFDAIMGRLIAEAVDVDGAWLLREDVEKELRALLASLAGRIPQPSALKENGQPFVVGCEDCGLPYRDFPLDLTIPDADWEVIHPGSNGGGLLCAQCIVTRASRLPDVTVVRATFERVTEGRMGKAWETRRQKYGRRGRR